MYANSPHVGLSAPSPLPSPLKYHDSPSFTYPTPPASHEAQSPSVNQPVVSNLPILSPSAVHPGDNFIEPVMTHNTDVDEVRNTSSPLSAAFFTTTMSSAEEVEEALEEVLPGESIVHGDALDMYNLSNPSPPSQTSMCVTPLPSPLSNQQPPNLHSPCPQQFIPTENIAFSNQQIHPLQSQMMPNSDDPLLSSSPKDFGTKKKFDFSGYQSYKIISHSPIDINNPGVTGILVEANGEYKLIQAASNQLPVSWLTGATHQIVSKDNNIPQVQIIKPASIKTEDNPLQSPQIALLQSQQHRTQQIKIEEDAIKQEIMDTIQCSSNSPSSPQKISRKRPSSSMEMSSRCFPTHYQSKFKSDWSDHFRPSPMLNPTRSAPGLYNEVNPNGKKI